MKNNTCPLIGKCGGCQILHLPYEKTIELKKQYVLECFKKEGIRASINKIIPAKDHFKYRNKMIIGFKMQDGKVVSGFYEENSHKIIDLNYCLMHSDLQNEIAMYIKELVKEYKLKPYDEDKQVGVLRYVLIREAIYTKEVLITFVTASEVFPARADITKKLLSKFKEVKTIIQNINPRKTSIVLGEKENIIFGKGFIEDKLMGLSFKITSKSFYQINPKQTELLYQEVIDNSKINKNETLIDAYSGIGTIGMILSKNALEVISVENNPQAHKAAIMNAKDNKIKNVFFVHDDATEFIDKFARENEKVDCLVMDPPRTGSTPKFLKNVIKLAPKKLIYVSCGPDTLARDLKILLENYQINYVSITDMFCFTKHVETVVVLSYKGNTKTSMKKEYSVKKANYKEQRK